MINAPRESAAGCHQLGGRPSLDGGEGQVRPFFTKEIKGSKEVSQSVYLVSTYLLNFI